MEAKDPPGSFGGAQIPAMLPLAQFVQDGLVHRDIVADFVGPLERILVQVLEELNAASVFDIGMSLPELQQSRIVFYNQSVETHIVLAMHGSASQAIWAMAITGRALVMRVAPDVENGFLRERPGAAFDAVLIGIVRVACMGAAVDHVLQHEGTQGAVCFW